MPSSRVLTFGGNHDQQALKPINMLDIPSELLDIVVEHLCDDKAALESCSLVSKSWSRSSRDELFHRLALVISRSDPSLQLFFELISSPLSTYNATPRCLALHIDDSWSASNDQGDEPHWTSIDQALTKILASARPNELSLSFCPHQTDQT